MSRYKFGFDQSYDCCVKAECYLLTHSIQCTCKTLQHPRCLHQLVHFDNAEALMDAPKIPFLPTKGKGLSGPLPSSLFNLINEKQKRHYKKGEYIYRQGDLPESIYLLSQGRLKIGTQSPSGKEVLKYMIESGSVFGELGLFVTDQRTEFAKCIENCTIYTIPLKVFDKACNTDVNLIRELNKLIGQKLIRTEHKVESLVFKDARTRIVELICDTAREKGEQMGFETVVKNFNLTHQDIANLTGTSRQTVTSVINKLKDEDLIHLNRRDLLIRNISRLESA